MAKQHFHAPAVEEPCAYLPGLPATTEYRVLTDVSPTEQEHLLERGWRRFGAQYFRPVCRGCLECVSLRLPVATFQPTKSQRRAWKKCRGLRVEVRAPIANEERLALFRAWHAMREKERGWQPSPMTLKEYHGTFCDFPGAAREFAYYDGDRLVAIGHVDVTPRALSSIYFFYHPDCRPWSLGVASVLFEIAWAQQNGRDHLYLGYRVLGCRSTAYKSQYGPHELLVGRPELWEEAEWRGEGGELSVEC